MYNKVILVGNLTRDVNLSYSGSGLAIAKFAVATNRTYKDNMTGQNKNETMFIDITTFGRSAEVANQYLRRGSKVLIEGRLVLNQWVGSDGTKRSKHEIVAEQIKFLDSKNDTSGFDNSYQTPSNPPVKQQMNQKEEIKEIQIDDNNINEDEVPF